MRSLFMKLLLSFIGITLLASLTTGLLAFFSQTTPRKDFQRRFKQHQLTGLDHSLDITRLAMTKLVTTRNQEQLIPYIQEVAELNSSDFFLIKQDNSTVSGRPLTLDMQKLATQVRSNGARQQLITETHILIIKPLPAHPLLIGGITAKITAPPFLKGKRFFMGHPLSLPILTLVLISIIGCYFLARSLTKPIRKLRTATWRIRQGDYAARIELPTGHGDEITELSRDFNIMAEQTQSLLESQKRLLRDISHELRSPLTRQNIAVELARGQFPKGTPFLDRISKESDRLNELIDQLLTLTRAETNIDPIKEVINLRNLLYDITQDADFETSGTNRTIDFLPSCDGQVLGSTEMLRRAFENVIRNSLRYTEDNSTIQIKMSKEDDQIGVQISDQGPGVPQVHLEQIFKPFFRVAKSRTRDSGGTGIGLAIAKQAIVHHGGTIQAKNNKPHGLLIEIKLPLHTKPK